MVWIELIWLLSPEDSQLRQELWECLFRHSQQDNCQKQRWWRPAQPGKYCVVGWTLDRKGRPRWIRLILFENFIQFSNKVCQFIIATETWSQLWQGIFYKVISKIKSYETVPACISVDLLGVNFQHLWLKVVGCSILMHWIVDYCNHTALNRTEPCTIALLHWHGMHCSV